MTLPTRNFTVKDTNVPREIVDKTIETLKLTIGYEEFGEQSILLNVNDLGSFVDSQVEWLRTFTATNVLQYQIPSIFTLISVIRSHLDKAVEDDDISALLLAQSYANTCYDLIDTISIGLSNRDTPGVFLAPSFNPPVEDLKRAQAIVYVIALTLKIVTEEIGGRLRDSNSQ